MRKIFIDANIYLGFFNSNKPEFKKLLVSLTELSDKLFVTQQVIDEINRNKLGVFTLSVENYLRQANLSPTMLPAHLDGEEDLKVKTWNDKRKKLEGEATELNKELSAIITQLCGEIAISQDTVSKQLARIFAHPLKLNVTTLTKAKARKEIGNPPGKNNDPLGDQLSWTLILENIQSVSEFWLVTNDADYFTEYDRKLYLNPLLYNDLVAANPNIKVNVFNKLSDALADFSSKEKVTTLPPEKELEKISAEEPDSLKNPPGTVRTIIGKFFGGGIGKPTTCPNCGVKNSFTHGGYHPSQYGGLTYQYLCTSCLRYIDTGDSWD